MSRPGIQTLYFLLFGNSTVSLAFLYIYCCSDLENLVSSFIRKNSNLRA